MDFLETFLVIFLSSVAARSVGMLFFKGADREAKKNADSERIVVKNSPIFIAVGMKPETDFVKELVETDDKGYIVAGEDGITSRAGIFVAGDARTKKLRQVITAVADGACAVDSAEKYLCR